MKEGDHGDRTVDLSCEIFEWRRHLRQTEYLKEPNLQSLHTGLDGTEMDRDLVNFSANTKGNRELYLEDIAAGHYPGILGYYDFSAPERTFRRIILFGLR